MAHAHRIATLALGTALTALVAAPAFSQAQTQDPEAAAAAATSWPGTPESAGDEIIVTARRVAESLQQVPAAVSAFDQRALERIQATDTTGLQGAVPNLNIVQGRGSSNATNIYIRGIGQPDALQTFDPAVGFYVDDVYYSRIRGTQIDLLDLERVEVLRGPQGTLYGKNTIGGAFKVVTRKPDQDFRAMGTLALGSYDQVELRAGASGPVTDTLAAGFSILRATRDGFVTDPVLDREYNDRDTLAGRVALAFTPSPGFRLDLSADYARDDASLNVGQPLNSLTDLFYATVILPLPTNPDSYDFTGRTTPSLPNSTQLRHWGVTGIATLDLAPALTLKSISAYRALRTVDYIDIDATELEVGDVLVDVDQNQFSQELQLAYDGGGLQAVAGLYYLRENVASHQEAYADDLIGPLLGNPTFLRTIDDELTTNSYAAYANASYALTDALRVSAGIRFTREEKDYWRTTSTFSSNPLLTSPVPYVFSPDGSWEDVSPMASIDYRFSPDVMAYARIAKGFKSGGFNGRANSAADATAYAPEEVVSYEAGIRATIARQFRLNLTGFRNDYENFQARVAGTDTDPVTGLPLPVLGVLNAGELRIQGIELEASWTPLDRLFLDAQVGYLDAEYREFADARFPGGSRAFQTPAFAPEWTLRFGAQYDIDLGAAGNILIGGQSRYRSETALAVDNTFITPAGVGTTDRIEGLFQEGYWLHDARIVWEDASRRYSVGLHANNLTDRTYKTDGQEFSSIGSIRTVYYGAPRTFTLRLTARY